ncbi:phytoene/squalene synthase family protein [soil metagenome]
MINLFHTVCGQCSRATTRQYSTSFSNAITLLHKDIRQAVYNIYGLVRFADEIVDSFHNYDKRALLQEFRNETYLAIDRGISLNPILHSFQLTVNEYDIDRLLIDAFFHSMELDLDKNQYDTEGYSEYIYGSAEVVGLMCLYVFCEGNKNTFDKLKKPARSLGAAFQKVNFLRDLKADFEGLERVYFPGCDFTNFTECDKRKIEKDIQSDFDAAYLGIVHLPLKARFGVYVAYKYYLSLFKKIKRLHASNVMERRVRIPNYSKAVIVAKASLRSQLNIL